MHHVTHSELDWRTDDPRWADEPRESAAAPASVLSLAPPYRIAAGATALVVAIIALLSLLG